MATTENTSKPKRGRPSAERVNRLIEEGSGTTSKTQCRLCKRVFPREKSLNTHMKSHVGERPYVCTFPYPEPCLKKFVQSGQLKTHERTHTNEKCFICPLEGCNQTQRHVNRKCTVHTHLSLARWEDKEYIPKFIEKYNQHPDVMAWFEDHLQKDNKRRKNKNNQEKSQDNSLNSTQDISYVSIVDSSSVLDYSSFIQNSMNSTTHNATVDSNYSTHDQMQSPRLPMYDETAHNSYNRNFKEPNNSNAVHLENLSTLNTSDIMSSPLVKSVSAASCRTPTTNSNTTQHSFYSTPIGDFKSPHFVNGHNQGLPNFLTPIEKPRASANLFPSTLEKEYVSPSTHRSNRPLTTSHEPVRHIIKSRRALLSDMETPKYHSSVKSLSNASSQVDLREKKLSYQQLSQSKSFSALPCKSPNIAHKDHRYQANNFSASKYYNYSQSYNIKKNDCPVPSSNAYRNEMSNYNLLDGIKPLELPVTTHSVNQDTIYNPNEEFKFTLRKSSSRDSDCSTGEVNSFSTISCNNEMPQHKTLPSYSDVYPNAINDAYSKYEEKVRKLNSEDSALQMMLTENRNGDNYVEVVLSVGENKIKEEYSPVREHDYAAKSTSLVHQPVNNDSQNQLQLANSRLITKGSRKYFDPQTEEQMRNQMMKGNISQTTNNEIIKRERSPYINIMDDKVADHEAALSLSSMAYNTHIEARVVNGIKTEAVVTPELSPSSVDSAYKSQCTPNSASDEENICYNNQNVNVNFEARTPYKGHVNFEARTPYKGHVGPVRGSHDFSISNNGFTVSSDLSTANALMNLSEFTPSRHYETQQLKVISEARINVSAPPVNYRSRSPIRSSPRKTPKKNYYSATKNSPMKSPRKMNPKKMWMKKCQKILSPSKIRSPEKRGNASFEPLQECSNFIPARRISYDRLGLNNDWNAENETVNNGNEDQPLNLSLH